MYGLHMIDRACMGRGSAAELCMVWYHITRRGITFADLFPLDPAEYLFSARAFMRSLRSLTLPAGSAAASKNIRDSNVFEGINVYSKTPRSLWPLGNPTPLSAGPAPPKGKL